MQLEKDVAIARCVNRLFNIHDYATIDMRVVGPDGMQRVERIFIDLFNRGDCARSVGMHLQGDWWYYFPS